jgi:hypothetical protein
MTCAVSLSMSPDVTLYMHRVDAHTVSAFKRAVSAGPGLNERGDELRVIVIKLNGEMRKISYLHGFLTFERLELHYWACAYAPEPTRLALDVENCSRMRLLGSKRPALVAAHRSAKPVGARLPGNTRAETERKRPADHARKSANAAARAHRCADRFTTTMTMRPGHSEGGYATVATWR